MRNWWLYVSLQLLARNRGGRGMGNTGKLVDARGVMLGIVRCNMGNSRAGLAVEAESPL